MKFWKTPQHTHFISLHYADIFNILTFAHSTFYLKEKKSRKQTKTQKTQFEGTLEMSESELDSARKLDWSETELRTTLI